MYGHLIPLEKAEDFPLSLDDTLRMPLLHFSLIPPHLLSTTRLHQHQHRSGTSHWSLVASQQFRLRAALSICFFETLDLQKSPTYTAMCGVHTCGGSSCVWVAAPGHPETDPLQMQMWAMGALEWASRFQDGNSIQRPVFLKCRQEKV